MGSHRLDRLSYQQRSLRCLFERKVSEYKVWQLSSARLTLHEYPDLVEMVSTLGIIHCELSVSSSYQVGLGKFYDIRGATEFDPVQMK